MRFNEGQRQRRGQEQGEISRLAFDPLDIYDADEIDIPTCSDAGENYVNSRRALLQNLGEAAVMASIVAQKEDEDVEPPPNLLLTALMVEHSLDLLEIMKRWNAHGHICPSFLHTFKCMDVLFDEHSKMYSVCKYFCRKGTKNTSIFVDADDENGPLELIGAPCLDHNDDIGESTVALDLSHLYSSVEALFHIYRLKFWLYDMTSGLRIINEHCLDCSQDCTSLIGEYLGVRACWWQVPGGARVYLGQAREILSALNRYDRPHLLHIQERAPALFAGSDWSGERYFHCFLRHTEREILPVPRNEALETRRLDLAMKRGSILLQNRYQCYLMFVDPGRHIRMMRGGNREQYNLELASKGGNMNDILDEYRNVLENPKSREAGLCKDDLKIEEAFARAHFHRNKYSSRIKSLFATMGLDSAQIWPEDYGNSLSLGPHDPWDSRLLNATHPDIAKVVDVLRRHNLMNRENSLVCFGTSALFVDHYY
eukprot:CAMPEP_0194076636 /NCGR_PEP_ID=MMETSP0149-20130528/3409_1 /TAXON_ID=122233 /ORGANISM="Chaetoceros debilis, Strain MM31A-1" /LENGTH=482 /DNA_ID=CAMNT_0038757437 /DNA_START=324 /DNA_END=1772 /DNA_ORIENTATION=-